jgi:hypothetical protein
MENLFIILFNIFSEELVLSRKGREEPIEAEIIESLMGLRSYLENRIHTLEEEIEKLKSLFTIVDEEIVSKSFKKAESIPIVAVKSPEQPKVKETIPLKTSTGKLLATVLVGEDIAKMIPAEGITYTTNIPPFQQFLVTRILKSMSEKDADASQKGDLLPNQIFSYEIITEDNIIKEIVISNYRTQRRLRELISASRWTFDKMYDNIQTTS